MTEEENPVHSGGRLWLRIIWSIAKILFVPVLCIVALGAGLVIGYVYIGGGDSSEVTHLSTWKHLYDLVFAP